MKRGLLLFLTVPALGLGQLLFFEAGNFTSLIQPKKPLIADVILMLAGLNASPRERRRLILKVNDLSPGNYANAPIVRRFWQENTSSSRT